MSLLYLVFISLNLSVFHSYHILSHFCPRCWKRMSMGFELKIVYNHVILLAMRLLNRALQVYNWWNWGRIILRVWRERQGRLWFGQTNEPMNTSTNVVSTNSPGDSFAKKWGIESLITSMSFLAQLTQKEYKLCMSSSQNSKHLWNHLSYPLSAFLIYYWGKYISLQMCFKLLKNHQDFRWLPRRWKDWKEKQNRGDYIYVN